MKLESVAEGGSHGAPRCGTLDLHERTAARRGRQEDAAQEGAQAGCREARHRSAEAVFFWYFEVPTTGIGTSVQ